MTPPDRLSLLEADLARRSATRTTRPRRRPGRLSTDDGTPVSMSIGGRTPGTTSRAQEWPATDADPPARTVAPLLPVTPAPSPRPVPAPPSATTDTTPDTTPRTTVSPAPAPAPAPAPEPVPAPAPSTSAGRTPPTPTRPRPAEDDSFTDDLMTILASHRPDPASPPVPEPAAATPKASEPATDQPTEPPVVAAQSHAVFDRLGKQMSGATTYDLGPVALDRRLDELDRVIDAEDQTAHAAQARVARTERLRDHDEELDVGEVRDALAGSPTTRRVVHPVPASRTRPGLTCAAAAASSVVAWRDHLDPATDDLPAGAGPWAPYASGRQARTESDLAVWGLTVSATAGTDDPTVVGALVDQLEAHGPLWLAAAPPGDHAVVLAGASTDGTAPGTRLTVLDPCTPEPTSIEMSWPDLLVRLAVPLGAPLTLARLTTTT